MSQNAEIAYRDGRKPLSKITAADLKSAGWGEGKGFALFLAREKVWTTTEWHHSGGYAAKVDFYDPADLIDQWDDLTDARQRELRDAFEASKAKISAPKPVRVRGLYTEWHGQGRRRRSYDTRYTGTKIGDWIIMDHGDKKKKATGKYIWYEEIKEEEG